jgi:hypothetical protein
MWRACPSLRGLGAEAPDFAPETRAAAQRDARIRLLGLEQFRRGLAAWP